MEMVELPQGDVTEVRRGGPDSLQLLSTDIARLSTTCYLRIERRPKDEMPRIGHIGFKDGAPMMALHESDSISMALEALLDIESDCALLDSFIAVHELPLSDMDRILNLYPEAHFQSVQETKPKQENHQWWSKSRFRTSSWRREERLPEMETVVEAPEALRHRSRAMMQRFDGLEKMLRPGDAYFFDSADPSPLFDLAGQLAVHGRPLLVLARHDIESLNVEHNIPIASSSWLSQNNGKKSIEPSLDNIRRKIDSFLWENLRAVVVLEGIEYLSSLHGDDRVVNFLRDIVDGVRLEDHLFLTTADFNAFSLTTRQHLSRYMTDLEASVLEHWNLEPDLLLDHPLCAPASEEEKQWIEQQLQQAIASSSGGPIAPQSSVFGTMEGGLDAPESEDVQAATESLHSVVQEWSNENEEEAIEAKHNDELVPNQSFDEPTHRDISTPKTSVPETILHDSIATVIEMESKETVAVQASKKRPVIAPPAAPRRAKKVRRKKKKSVARPNRKNQLALFAAVRNATEAKDLSDIDKGKIQPPQAISSKLDNYTNRQEKAVAKMSVLPRMNSSVLDATRQHVNTREHRLPETPLASRPIEAVNDRMPVDTQTSLTPHMARPGAMTQNQGDKPSREGAFRRQSKPSLEDKLSVWEIEDRERLRKEKEAEEK
ncbi:MAG: DUF835 domain-containing protein [Candidatus Poseidoniales archaeon]|nr:MAG: DUF835 domain-containing protein [Candidatus Poseidoniales archaeon]